MRASGSGGGGGVDAEALEDVQVMVGPTMGLDSSSTCTGS